MEGGKYNFHFWYGNENVENVIVYKYRGINIDFIGTINAAVQNLSNKGVIV